MSGSPRYPISQTHSSYVMLFHALRNGVKDFLNYFYFMFIFEGGTWEMRSLRLLIGLTELAGWKL